MTDATQPRMARGRMLPAGILVAALFAMLAFAPIASATPDPVGSGSTKITLNNGWVKYLKTFGIKIQKVGSTKVKGKQVTFQVSEGSMDPTNGLGTLSLAGGIQFKAGKKKAPVKAMVLDTAASKVTAKIGGKKVKFATVKGLTYSRNGFGVNVTVKKLQLTNSAANMLNKKTGYAKGKPKPFLKNKLIGKSKSEVQPATVAIIAGAGAASLSLAPEALAKLQHVGTPPYPAGSSPVKVDLSPVAPTTFDLGTLTAGFPIGGGTIAPTATAGTVYTEGGLKLVQNLESVASGVTTLTMGNIWVDMGAKTASVEVIIENPSFEPGKGPNLGNLGRASIADIDLSTASITSDPTGRTVSVAGAKATLQAVTAATLNQVFIEGLESASPLFVGQEKFAAGDPLGTVNFTVQTQ